jgi:hypothetical protein
MVGFYMAKSLVYNNSFDVSAPLIMYKGGITYELIAKARNFIRANFTKTNLQYKLQSIFIELAQNVLLYSEEKNLLKEKESVGTIVLDEQDEAYILITGNVMKTETVKTLEKHCNHINSLDRTGLFHFKAELAEREPSPHSKGGGLGLLQVALLSGNEIQVVTEKIDDEYTYLGFCAKVCKESN